jgi:hypothetical protein
MFGSSRFAIACLSCALFACPVLAAAQADAPPAPEPASPPSPPPAPDSSSSSPPAASDAPAADPNAAPAEPPPAPAPSPAPQSEPAQQEPENGARFEGQVGPDDGSGYQGDDYESDEDQDQPEPEGGGGGDFEVPPFSIRFDPFNWLLEGRLGLELELGVWKFISIEMVPVFVANTEPPSFNFSGREDPISQHSNGLGPIAGTSIGAGFWLSGKPLSGYVLRAYFTNYGFTYESRVDGDLIDSVDVTERRLVLFIGSYSHFGVFTLGGGIGLGYELNQQQRCFVNVGTVNETTATSGCPDEDELQIDDGEGITDLNGPLHPMYIVARFSLGLAFD